MGLGFNLHNVTRKWLTLIRDNVASTPCTFLLYKDNATLSNYNQPQKDIITIATTCILSPIDHNDKWEGQGIDETAEFKLIVHELTSGGIDYIHSEWFVYNNFQNIRIQIEDRYYKVISKKGHVDLPDESPYWVLYISRLMDVQP